MKGSVYRTNKEDANWLKEKLKQLDREKWFYQRVRSNERQPDTEIKNRGKDQIEGRIKDGIKDGIKGKGDAEKSELKQKEENLAKLMEDIRREYRTKCEQSEERYIGARPFCEIKSLIEQDRLYKEVFRPMPKGGLLHVHSSAALSLEGFYGLLSYWNGKHTSQVDKSKCDDQSIFVIPADMEVGGKQKFLKNSLYYLGYLKMLLEQQKESKEQEEFQKVLEMAVPITPYLVQEVWDGEDGLASYLAFTAQHKAESAYVWNDLNAMFVRVDNLFSDKYFYQEYHERFFKECLTDKISYVELRSGFVEFIQYGPAGTLAGADWQKMLFVTHEEYSVDRHFYFKEMFQEINYDNPVFLQCIKDAADKSGLKKENVRVILNVRRDLEPGAEKLKERLDYAIAYHCAKKFDIYNQLVIGFDFVSEEDRGRPTEQYFDLIFGLTETKADIDVRKPRIQMIDFYLHDGESLWKGGSNVLDAALVSQYRIGHGFQMAYFPALIDQVVDTPYIGGVAYDFQPSLPILEVCPISNQVLQYFPDLRSHTAYQLMQRGIQCVLANDDPFMFGNPGLSYDFWMAYVGMELDFPAVKTLVYNSILPMVGYDTSKSLAEFDEAWVQFVDGAIKNLSQ